MAERWLVIAHDATNSGAPRMLLQVLQGVRALRGEQWSCDILLGRAGPLVAEFAQLGPIHRLSHPWAAGRSLRARVFARFVDRPWIQPRRLAGFMHRVAGVRYSLIYNNTSANGSMVAAARSLRCPILTHVHELSYSMRRFNTPAGLARTMTNTDHFIAVSPPVAEDLMECGAPAERITVVPNFLPQLPAEPSMADREILRQQLGLPVAVGVITGCGYFDWVKGTDLFVEVAAVLAQQTAQPVCFAWLGGVHDPGFARRVRRLVRRRNLEHAVRFVGAVDDPAPWFAASDAVAVTSRFESFSLVALEAAALGRPVVGFSGARGLSCVIGDVPSLLAPGHDPVAMAARLQALLRNPTQAQEVGRQLRNRVRAEFLAPPRIEAILSVVARLQRPDGK